MARFFRDFNHYINLDDFSFITIPTKSEDEYVRFATINGRHESSRNVDIQDLEKALMPIIPAAANTWATVIWSDGDDGGVDQQPIVGWRDHNGYAEPILNQEPSSNQFVFMETPAGKFLHLAYDGMTYLSLVEAAEFVRTTVQQLIRGSQ